MKVVTVEEMRNIDKKTIKDYGISGAVLMERAGLAVAKKVRELFEEGKVIVLTGGGNNGGDGFVAARELHNLGWNVKVLLLAKEDKLSPDCRIQYRIAKKMGVKIEFRNKIDNKDLHSAVVIDAIFGTGLSKDVTGKTADIISFLNKSRASVISVDIPSGISSDTGRVLGKAVSADYTVTFGLPKRGHLLYSGAEYTGKLFIEDIGFPESLLKSDRLKVNLSEIGDVSLLIPERQRYSHKGDYGHVLVVAGSRGKTGAAFMCAKACLRAGAGLVTIGVPESLLDIFQSGVTEEMTLPLSDRGDGILSAQALDTILEFLSNKADVLAIGPGISDADETRKLIANVVLNSTAPMVMDADAINALQGKLHILRKAKAPIILTPHPGEMARLLQGSKGQRVKGSREIEKDRINTAVRFSKETGTYLVLKGVPTIIAEPDGSAFINPTGNPGMASAGVGDVLTGMTAAFLGQGLNPLEASILGVYMHGLGGNIAVEKKGEHSLIASDIIDSISHAFHSMKTSQLNDQRDRI
ncbi:MAG: NAD(P)H-hydrate dehydratase [Nitrospirae bacterium]|nr:NAD(P)H-hydrate dehydratase [Nitrospirota bacterium]